MDIVTCTSVTNLIKLLYATQPITNILHIIGDSIFVIEGESWKKYDEENFNSPSRSTFIRISPREDVNGSLTY